MLIWNLEEGKQHKEERKVQIIIYIFSLVEEKIKREKK